MIWKSGAELVKEFVAGAGGKKQNNMIFFSGKLRWGVGYLQSYEKWIGNVER